MNEMDFTDEFKIISDGFDKCQKINIIKDNKRYDGTGVLTFSKMMKQ